MRAHAKSPAGSLSLYLSEQISVFLYQTQDNLFINLLLTEGSYLNKVMYINQTTSLFFRVTGRLNEGQAMLELSLLLPGDELSSPHYLSHKLIPCIRIKYAFSKCVHLFLESLLLSAATCKAYD